MKRTGSLLFVLMLFGCGSGAVDGGGLGEDAQGDGDKILVQGRVSLGTPVAGATVTALVYDETQTWQEVDQGLSDDNGSFAVKIPEDLVHRPLRVVATGAEAHYTEVADGAMATLGEDGHLLVDVETADECQGTVIEISAWTTLAGCAAEAYMEGYEVGGAVGWTEAMLLARLRVRDHLAGDRELDLPVAGPSDLSAGPWPYPNPSTSLGLAAAGLSSLVRGQEATPGTSAVLVDRLCRDLSDGLFDGREHLPGESLVLGSEPGLPALNADTTRVALAAATHDFLLSQRNLSGLTPEQVAEAGGYFDVVSMDEGPLYPADSPPTRFDPVPPVLTFVGESPDEDTCLSAPFTLTVAGEDPYGTVNVRFDGTTTPGPLAADEVPTAEVRALEIDPALFEGQGPRSFRFSGTDAQGNKATIERRLILDTHGPTISVVTPDQSACAETWPDLVTLSVVDNESSVAAVTGGTGPCTDTGGDLWRCPAPGAQEPTLSVTATDAAGNEATTTAWLCKDHEPPAISFGTWGELGWWGPASGALVVEITDGQGIAAWSATDGDGLAMEPGSIQTITNGVALSFDLPQSEDTFGLTVHATDPAENSKTETLSLLRDATPPSFDPAVPSTPLGSVMNVSFLVSVSDEHSGIGGVAVASPGTWSTTQESLNAGPGEDVIFRISGVPEVPGASSLSVELLAEDAVGNQETHVVEVLIDQTPPTIELAWSEFRDESDCQASLDEDGDLIYDCPGPMVELSSDTCTTQGCPPVVKLASRLGYQGTEDVDINNLPTIGLGIEDSCPLEDPGPCTMSFAWTFYRGDEALFADAYDQPIDPLVVGGGELLYGGIVILSAKGMFGVPAEDADLSEEAIPDRLVLSATDAGGNLTTLELPLDLTLLPPPILFQWTSHGDPSIQAMEGAEPSELSLAMDVVAQDLDSLAGAPEVEAARFTLTNPTTLPVMVDLAEGPVHEVMWIEQQGYLGEIIADSPCSPGACQFGEGPWNGGDLPLGSCGPPEILSAEIAPLTETPVTFDVLDPEGLLDWGEEGFALPPEAAVEVRLLVDMAPVPAVLPAVNISIWHNGIYTPASIHFLDVLDQWAICAEQGDDATLYRITPAISRVHSSTPEDSDSLEIVTRNPGAQTAAVREETAGWNLIYLNQWPANLTLP